MQTIEQAARTTMQHLDTGARNAVLGRTRLRSDAESTLIDAGLLNGDGSLTEIGQEIEAGWTCERCDEWHPVSRRLTP